MYDRVAVTNIRQELIAKTFAFTSTSNKSGYVDKGDGGWDDFFSRVEFLQFG